MILKKISLISAVVFCVLSATCLGMQYPTINLTPFGKDALIKLASTLMATNRAAVYNFCNGFLKSNRSDLQGLDCEDVYQIANALRTVPSADEYLQDIPLRFILARAYMEARKDGTFSWEKARQLALKPYGKKFILEYLSQSQQS